MYEINTDPDAEENAVLFSSMNEAFASLELQLAEEFGADVTTCGGFLMAQYLPDKARGTSDVDFNLKSEDYYDKAISIATKWADDCVKSELAENYRARTPGEGKGFGLFLYRNNTMVGGTDIGVHVREIDSTLMLVDGVTVSRQTPENIVADKFSAFLTIKRHRRPKDMYDLWLLLNTFDLDLARIHSLLRVGDFVEITPEIQSKLEYDFSTLKLKKFNENDFLERPAFSDVITVILLFYSRLIAMIEKRQDDQWKARNFE